MCPFKKAFPLAVLVHLLLVAGIVGAASEASHRQHIFKLHAAVGQGDTLAAGSDKPRCPLRPEVIAENVKKLEQLAESLFTKPEVVTPKALEESPKSFAKPPEAVSAPTKVAQTPPAAAQVAPPQTDAPATASTNTAAGSIAADKAGSVRLGGAVEIGGMGNTLTPPIALHKPKPYNPSRHKGEVTAIFTINEEGRVENPEIVKAPSPLMAEAVLKVLPQWRFEPAKLEGQPIALKVRQVVEF